LSDRKPGAALGGSREEVWAAREDQGAHKKRTTWKTGRQGGSNPDHSRNNNNPKGGEDE